MVEYALLKALLFVAAIFVGMFALGFITSFLSVWINQGEKYEIPFPDEYVEETGIFTEEEWAALTADEQRDVWADLEDTEE